MTREEFEQEITDLGFKQVVQGDNISFFDYVFEDNYVLRVCIWGGGRSSPVSIVLGPKSYSYEEKFSMSPENSEVFKSYGAALMYLTN